MPSVLRENVEAIRKKRGLSKAELSERIKRDRAELDELLESNRPPKTLIGALADQLVVPDFALYMKNLDVQENLADFREAEPALGAYEKSTIKAIEAGRNIKHAADEICARKSANSLNDYALGDNISARAQALRAHLGISDQAQLEAKDARIFYGIVRKAVETSNTFVTQYSFDDGAGFCLSTRSGFDYICINTKNQTYQRRLFTLGHEIYHCVTNKSGLSDPEKVRNTIERQCNSFSIEFLAPISLARKIAKRHISSRNFQLGELKAFSASLKISLHASVIRLIELNIYSKDALGAWISFQRDNINPDSESKSGGRRVEEWKYKLAKHGYKFADVYGRALEEHKIDALDIFRLARIKPRYQNDYFKFASTATLEDVDDE